MYRTHGNWYVRGRRQPSEGVISEMDELNEEREDVGLGGVSRRTLGLAEEFGRIVVEPKHIGSRGGPHHRWRSCGNVEGEFVGADHGVKNTWCITESSRRISGLPLHPVVITFQIGGCNQ